MLPPDEGDLCGVNGCTGTFQFQPPSDSNWGCSCHISPPCGWCVAHELRCTNCNIFPEEIEAAIGPLVSLDSDPDLCHSDQRLLRITPELHWPKMEVFEVPDEFNGNQRGTFYFRTGSGVLFGPYKDRNEAEFKLSKTPTDA